MKKKYLEAGKVQRVHGVRGEVKFAHWCDSPGVLKKITALYFDESGEKKLCVCGLREAGDALLIKFTGFDDPESARSLVNKVLYADRNELIVPDGVVFISDLIGLDLVDDSNGKVIGRITDVVNRGSCDLYLVDLGDSRQEYFPAVKEFIVKKDLDKEVRVRVPEGLFGENK